MLIDFDSIRVALVTASTILLAGCGASEVRNSTGLSPVEPEFVESSMARPDPLARSRASVGDVMLTAGEFDYQPESHLYKSIRIQSQPDLEVQHRRSTFRFPLSSGPYKLVAETQNAEFYQFITRIGEPRSYGGLVVPFGTNQATEFFWWWAAHGPKVPVNVYSVPLDEPINVEHTEYRQPLGRTAASVATSTLTYAGVAGRQIKFVYKEFTERGMARPAYTQEVSLDYQPGETYAFRDARFIVHEAGTTHIIYTLLAGL